MKKTLFGCGLGVLVIAVSGCNWFKEEPKIPEKIVGIKNEIPIIKQKTIEEQYVDVQAEFLTSYSCGVTDFDSPYVKETPCPTEKYIQGSPITVSLKLKITDEKNNTIKDVKVKINDGDIFNTDENGELNQEIKVNSTKKAIYIVADKIGYSPIRKILNAEIINKDKQKIEIPKTFETNIVMRKIEVKKVIIEKTKETYIESNDYPGLSIRIPAGGLVNSKGEVVTGEITGEITYLNPNNPEDAKLTPGFDDGKTKRMLGVNRKGEIIQLDSEGMTYFHFKEKDSNELLKLKEGVVATISQPMIEKALDYFNDSVIQQKAKITVEDLKAEKPFYEKLGITDDMSKEEIYKILFKNDLIAYHYWYFNQRTGLWEAWPVSSVEYDKKNKSYKMEITALY